jgi:hypothetical protein
MPRRLGQRPIRSAVTLAGLGLALACALGCENLQWTKSPALRAPDDALMAALEDFGYPAAGPAGPSEVPVISPPTNLRPCCAFGTGLRIELGVVPIPGFSLENLRGPDEVGPHRYGAGMLSMSTAGDRRLFERERNGQIYTCRGGFIDLAHVRDYADETLFLTAAIARVMDTGGAIELAPLGGSRKLVLRAVPASAIEGHGRRLLAVRLAQWAAFQLALWHEIAQFYGHSSLASWPEKVSGFSPEDLYSDLLGTKLAGGIILRRQADDEFQYNRSMDAWIQQVLARLEAVPRSDAYAAMRAVDGLWWDSGQRLPNWTLVRHRHFGFEGDVVAPWLVSQAPGVEPSVAGCAGARSALELRNPHGFEGTRFDSFATLEIEAGAALAQLPLPRPPKRALSQADFPWIAEHVRRENAAEFGAGADRPGPPPP